MSAYTRSQYSLLIREDGTGRLVEQSTGRIVPPERVRAMRWCVKTPGVLVEFYEEPGVFLMDDEIRWEVKR